MAENDTNDGQSPAAVPAVQQQPGSSIAARMQIGSHTTPYFVPRTMEEAGALAKSMVATGAAPECYNGDWALVRMGMLSGMELGLPPMQAVTSIYPVRGVMTVWGKAIKGLVARENVLEDYKVFWIDGTTWRDIPRPTPEEMMLWGQQGLVLIAERTGGMMIVAKLMAVPDAQVHVKDWPQALTCVVVCKRRGVASPFVGRFSVSQAMRAKLWNSTKKPTWIDYPEDMLEHKAAARVWDRGFADCLKGIAIKELVEEKDDPLELAQRAEVGFTGMVVEHQPPPEITPASEAAKLIDGLPKVATIDGLKNWLTVAEGTLDWLREKAPELCVKVGEAVALRQKELEAAGDADTKA